MSPNPSSVRPESEMQDSWPPEETPEIPAAGPGPTLEQPGLLHPSSVLFEIVSHLRQFIVPTVLGVIGAARGSLMWTGIAAVIFAGAMVHTLIRYFTLRYGIQGDDFVVTEGLFFRRVRSVPLRRIQNMDLVQNVLHRLFGVSEVNIETASGNKPEATLRVLTAAQIEELRLAIFGVDETEAAGSAVDVSELTDSPYGDFEATAATTVRNTAHDKAGDTLYQIPTRDLVMAGLASNRGLVLLGIAVGFFFQFDIEDRFDMDLISDQLQEQGDPWQIAGIAVAGFLALMILLRMLGIAWYVLRFYDYRLTRLGDDLRVSCGLLTKVSATIPRKRIQFISVHRPLLMRPMGLATIRIETAGGAGNQNENAAATVSRRWFLPVVAEVEVKRILNVLRPELTWEDTAVTWHGVSPLTARRLTRVALVVAIIFSVIGLAALRPWGWLVGVILFPPLQLMVIKKSRSRKYARTAWGIAFQSGIFNRKLSFAFYDRIQGLKLAQSPFDRRWRMATLCVDTAAAGPAEHTIAVAYLDDTFATQQFRELQTATAHHHPSWS